MKDNFSLIGRFLFRFSYSAKMSFIFYAGVIYSLFLLGMLFIIQYPIINSLKLQIKTLEGNQVFDEFAILNLQQQLSSIYFYLSINILILILGILAFVTMYLTQVIRRPLENLIQAAQAIAEGDLSVRVAITTHDEVAVITHSFNEMAAFFEKNIFSVNQISERLVKIATSIFDISKKFDSNMNNIEEDIQTIAQQAQEITKKMKNFNNSLNEVYKRSRVTSQLAQMGRANLNEMEAVLSQMNVASNQIVSTLTLIEKHVFQINSVINAVVEIADKNNLLSINVAIKVSKMGSEGSGFSVVADNIRLLADQTASFALDIELSFQEIIQIISRAILEIEKFSSQLIVEMDDEKIVSDGFAKLINHAEEQIKAFEKIRFDVEEQFKEYLQIQELKSDLDDVTLQASDSARKLYNDSEYLLRGTQSLQDAISKLHFKEQIN